MIRVTRSAHADIKQAVSYVEKRNARAADFLREQFKAEFERLEKFPEIGRVGRVTGTRERVVEGTNYVVAYRIALGDIQILAVRHARRLWPTLFVE